MHSDGELAFVLSAVPATRRGAPPGLRLLGYFVRDDYPVLQFGHLLRVLLALPLQFSGWGLLGSLGLYFGEPDALRWLFQLFFFPYVWLYWYAAQDSREGRTQSFDCAVSLLAVAFLEGLDQVGR